MMEEIMRELGFPPLDEIQGKNLRQSNNRINAKNENGTMELASSKNYAQDSLWLETGGDISHIYFGDELLWFGAADKAQAELASLQIASTSPLRLTGLAIKAALVQFPRLVGKFRAELNDAADAVMDEIAAVPVGDERMAAAEKAIADCIDRIIDAEAKRTNRNRMEIVEEFRAVEGK